MERASEFCPASIWAKSLSHCSWAGDGPWLSSFRVTLLIYEQDAGWLRSPQLSHSFELPGLSDLGGRWLGPTRPQRILPCKCRLGGGTAQHLRLIWNLASAAGRWEDNKKSWQPVPLETQQSPWLGAVRRDKGALFSQPHLPREWIFLQAELGGNVSSFSAFTWHYFQRLHALFLLSNSCSPVMIVLLGMGLWNSSCCHSGQKTSLSLTF